MSKSSQWSPDPLVNLAGSRCLLTALPWCGSPVKFLQCCKDKFINESVHILVFSGLWRVIIIESTGIDSSSTACIVSSMCHQVCQAVKNGDQQVLEDVRRIINDKWVITVKPDQTFHPLTSLLRGLTKLTAYSVLMYVEVSCKFKLRNLESSRIQI